MGKPTQHSSYDLTTGLDVPNTVGAYTQYALGLGPVGYWRLAGATVTDALRDLTSNNRNMIVGSATPPILVGDGPGGMPALHFDGVSHYVEVADNAAWSVATTGRLTISVWMARDADAWLDDESTGYVNAINKGSSGQFEWTIRTNGPTGSVWAHTGLVFDLTGAASAAAVADSTTGPYPSPFGAKSWDFIVFQINTVDTDATYPSGYCQIYRNGALHAKTSLAGVTQSDGTAPVRLGTRTLASFYRGAMVRFGIYNYELPISDIQTLYTLGR